MLHFRSVVRCPYFRCCTPLRQECVAPFHKNAIELLSIDADVSDGIWVVMIVAINTPERNEANAFALIEVQHMTPIVKCFITVRSPRYVI